MKTSATTISEFLDSLPPDRREAIDAVRATILKHLPAGYEEALDFGMIAYQVPLKVYPNTYNKKPMMYAGLANQKNYLALHLCTAYAIPGLREELEEGFKAAGKKLDMGKGCLRFKKLQDLPLPVIGKIIAATPMKAYVEFTRSVHAKK